MIHIAVVISEIGLSGIAKKQTFALIPMRNPKFKSTIPVLLFLLIAGKGFAQSDTSYRWRAKYGFQAGWNRTYFQGEKPMNFFLLGPEISLRKTSSWHCGHPVSTTALAFEYNFRNKYKSLLLSQRFNKIFEFNDGQQFKLGYGFDLNAYFNEWGNFEYSIRPNIVLLGFLKLGYSIPLSRNSFNKPTFQVGTIFNLHW